MNQSEAVVHGRICEIDRGFIGPFSSYNKLKEFRCISSLNICYISSKLQGKLPPHSSCVCQFVGVCL